MKNDLCNVFSGSAIQASFIEQILANENIRCVVSNRLMGSIIPASGGNPVDVLVKAEDVNKAHDIINSFDSKL